MHLIWPFEVKCVVTVWFLWSFWYILSNGVGDVTSRWRHFWFTSQHQSDLKYTTHNSGSHDYFYYHSHQHTRTWNKNIYIVIKDYLEIRVWSYLPQVAHSFWERPLYRPKILNITTIKGFIAPITFYSTHYRTNMKCVQTIILLSSKPQQSARLSLRPSINIQTAFALQWLCHSTLTPIIVKRVQRLWHLKKRIHAQYNNNK